MSKVLLAGWCHGSANRQPGLVEGGEHRESYGFRGCLENKINDEVNTGGVRQFQVLLAGIL